MYQRTIDPLCAEMGEKLCERSTAAHSRFTESERVTRIELALSAWEADVLPLNYTRRMAFRLVRLAPEGPTISGGA